MSPAGKASLPSNHRSFTPRPPRSADERLPTLYRALTDQVDDGYFQNAIKTFLALDASSTSAFQTLFFLNLHTDDYQAALDLLANAPSSSPLDFEKSYCLYRLHREKEAAVILMGLVERGRKELHLEAQVRYRLGEYKKAQELYDELLAGCDSYSPEHPDILTNISATTVHHDFLSHLYHSYLSVPPPPDLGSETPARIPSSGDLESYVPSLPAGWAKRGLENVKKVAPEKDAKKEKSKGKVRHKLPKGVAPGKPFTEDPDRWLPLRQRSSYIVNMSRKKGGNLSMGTGMTQGSTSTAVNAPGGGDGGGGKSKKGKKK
ncbi:MAG: hypothetical protein TREMPRED_001899 [Tremellales sp. Tagirdzhanova-0007]|nr:MAG: hypothetical protein TREMPRED_001899 [Tremellales sp. Tagirdzhanova-0007]